MKKFLILGLMLFKSLPAMASLEETYKREATVNTYTAALYDLKKARDHYFLGEHSYQQTASDFISQADAWLVEWAAWKVRLDATQAEDLGYVEAMVLRSIREQSSHLALLRGQLNQLLATGHTIRLKISGIAALEDSESLADAKYMLSNHAVTLLQAVDTLAAETKDRYEALAKMSEVFSFEFFVKRMRLAAIERGIDTTSPLFEEISHYIEAEALGQPTISAVKSEALGMRTLQVYRFGEALRQNWHRFETFCNQQQQKVDVMPVSEIERGRLKADIAGIYADELERYQTTMLAFSPGQLAASMHRGQIRRHRATCTRLPESEKCYQFEGLAGIDDEVVAAFDQQEITNLEHMWWDFNDDFPTWKDENNES